MTATLDLKGSTTANISATGQWNANSNLIYIRSGFAHIAVGQTVTIASVSYTVVGVLPRTKGPDPNDSFLGGVLVTPLIPASSGGTDLDNPANDASLTFATAAVDLPGPDCNGQKIGGCLFLNAAERAYSGGSAAGTATQAIPSSNGSQLAAGYFFDGVPGPRLLNAFSFAHQYGFILKDSNSATFSMEAGDENGELDDPNELFFGVFGDSNQTSVLANKNGQSGSSLVGDTYVATADDHDGLHNTVDGAIGPETDAVLTLTSALDSSWPLAGTLEICQSLNSNSDCNPSDTREYATYVKIDSTHVKLIARGQWGTMPQSFNASPPSPSTIFRTQISSWPGCVSFSSVSNPSTTSYLNDVEALHGCLLLTNVRTNGSGIGFVSRNILPSKFVATIMKQVALYFEDAQARGLLDTTTSLFLSGGQPAPGVTLPPPQGRLTCDSAAPVQTADQDGCTTIYYLPYTGWIVPVNDGRGLFSFYSIGSGVSLPLDNNSGHTGFQHNGNLYDLFVGFNTDGTIHLATGPAWTNATTRSIDVTLVNGIWVNAASITNLRYGTSSGNLFSCPAYACTYVGTMYATADGQTDVQFKPAGAGGGSNNFIGLWNAYNRVKAFAVSVDTSGNWVCSLTCGVWQPLDKAVSPGTHNRISVVDGLGQTAFDILLTEANVNDSSTTPLIGTCTDSTSCTPVNPAQNVATSRVSVTFNASNYPLKGFHFVQAMQKANSGGTGVFGTAATLRLDWEY